MRNYCYEADWRPYVYPEQRSGFCSEEQLEAKYTRVDLTGKAPLKAGGMPVWSDGRTALVNTETEHTLIYGGTASKKTRTLVLPLIRILAQARESMVIPDIKGELSDGVTFPEVRGMLEQQCYDCVYLNFRDMDGDGFNPLQEPYQLYQNGKKDQAMAMVNDQMESDAAMYHGTKADPFWEMTSKQVRAPVTELLYALCKDPDKVNMLTLGSYVNEEGCEMLERIAGLINKECNTMTMLRAVLAEPEKTRMSTLATVNSCLTKYLTNRKLMRMLSKTTFDIHAIGRRPTALFLILPDEVDTYGSIVGMILQQLSATLVRDAYESGGTLPVRVNMICDEFCNYHIPGMKQAISAHRSRNIRWYLVCQSRMQLKACYPEEADTIEANCTNLYFLNSPELSLMEYLSTRAGTTTITEDGSEQPILTVADLQKLKKGWTHTDVYFSTGDLHYVASLPDISLYAFPKGCGKPTPLPRRKFPTPEVYTPSQMYKDVKAIRYAYEAKKDRRSLSLTELELARMYEELFSEDD